MNKRLQHRLKIHPDVIAIITNITVERIEIIKLPWKKKQKILIKKTIQK